MSWFRRITLILSLSSFLIFSIALALNWAYGPGIENLAGQIKSSDLFQHYGAGSFIRERKGEDLYQGGQLGLWISRQHGAGKELKTSGFNYVYPPLVARVAAPLSRISYPGFALTWLGISLLVFLISAQKLLLFTKARQPLFWLFLLLGLPSLHYTLILGQNSCLTLFIICSAAFLLSQNRDVTAGLILSCLFYKPQFLPLLLGFMFIAGHRRFVLAAVLGSVAWLFLGLLLCGVESYSAWLSVLQKLNSGEQLQFADLNQTLKMFVLNLMDQASHPGKSAGLLTTLLGLSLLGLTALAVRFTKPSKKWSPCHSLLLASCVMTIASPYLMHYDLLLAAGWWFLCLQEQEDQGWKPKAYAALFWVVSLFSINTAHWPAPATAPLMLLYLVLTMKMYFNFSFHSNDRSHSSKPGQT